MNFSVRVNVLKNTENGKVRAYADAILAGEIKVTNISLIENGKGGIFISMPRYKSSEVDKDGNAVYKDICNPITRDFRDALCGALLNAYDEAKATGETVTKSIVDIMPEDDGVLKMAASVYPVKKEGVKTLAYAKIILNDSFVINNMTVMEGKNGLFVAMPSYKTKNTDENGKAEYREICYPVNKETREKIRDVVLEEYRKVKGTNIAEEIAQMETPFDTPEEKKAKEEETVSMAKEKEYFDKPIKLTMGGR